MTKQLAQDVDRLCSSSVVVRSDTCIDAEIDHEIVALSIARGTCYGLNNVGSRIWKQLATPTRISDLCASLLSEYDVEKNLCEQQVLEFLEELRSEELITNPRQ